MLRLQVVAGGANYIQVANGAAGAPAGISVRGADEDIDLRLAPRGNGRVQFGQYTAGATAVTGYISVKDITGVVRKLAVIS